ncbi:hypothetical protein Tco_0944154 [Tanacetum coccineum]
MALLTVVASRFPSTNNQLRTSSNPKNQATIQDDRVTIQQVQGRQVQNHVGNGTQGNAAGMVRNNACGHGKFQQKLLLVQAQENGQILEEEQLAFLADPGIPDGQATHITIPQNAAFQTKDLDAYDSDCDDLSSAKAVLMANLSSFDSNVLSKPHIDETPNNEITSDSNIIPYSQYLLESQSVGIQNMNSSTQHDLLVMSLVEQMHNTAADLDKQNQENSLENESLTTELERYKERKAQRIRPTLYDGNVICKQHVVVLVMDDEETLILEEESRSKMSKKFTKHVQELLVYVSKTCPNSPKSGEKLVVVTPLNKDKRVRVADPLTSSNNNKKMVDSNITKDSNNPLLHSTGVKCSTGASGSKPSGNTKKNRISQPSSRNKTNKVEDQSRSVKSRKNKKNRVDKPVCNADVMQSMLNANFVSEPISNALVKHFVRNANSESMCTICNKCLFDTNHDMCLIDYVNDVNVCSKSKSKRNKKRNVWKPTRKVFTKIGYSWKPTGRTFTIVGNRCPLTRITYTKVVPTKETTINSVLTPTKGILVYIRRPKASRCVGSSSKVKNVESISPNTTKPN